MVMNESEVEHRVVEDLSRRTQRDQLTNVRWNIVSAYDRGEIPVGRVNLARRDPLGSPFKAGVGGVCAPCWE